MTHLQKAPQPESTVLNSKRLFVEFLKLVTRPQYTMGDPSHTDVTQMTTILGAERVEETNEHRLKLAGLVLTCAGQCLEVEINAGIAERVMQRVQTSKDDAPVEKGKTDRGPYL
jgi:hypothetical protein